MSAPVVDMHAHAILGGVEAMVTGQAGLDAQRELDAIRNGPESLAVSGTMVRDRLPQLMELGRRLSDMDEAGVDIQVVSPSPSQYHYWAEPELARQVCRAANSAIAALVAQAPDRLRGIGLVPLQHPELCAELLEHAVDECGLVGVEISSHAPRSEDAGTVELSDAGLEPFWASAALRRAVVFLHPFGCTLDARLDKYYLSNVVGQPAENAVALSHLIFAGVLDRHPDLVLLAAHGGGYLPTYVGRSDHAWQTRPDSHTCERLPSEYLRQIYFDSLVHFPAGLRALLDAVGPERIVLGSDYPFDMGTSDPVGVLRAAGLDSADLAAISGGNAMSLLTPHPQGVMA